jgi:hypothetical protein
MFLRYQRRIKKRQGGVTKTTCVGVENKFATRLKSPLVADLKLFINLVFFMSFYKKD